MKNRILVTGATGYLGEAVLASLSPHYEVTALSMRLAEIKPLTLDFDAVVHTAGALRHRSDEHFSTNAAGTQRLLDGLVKPTRFILVSSRGVYSPSTRVLTENSPLGVADSYGSSKLEAERLVSVSGHPYIIIRSTAIYGWSVSQAGVTFPTQAVRSFLSGKPVAVYQPDRPHDYLFVWDLAQWILLLLGNGSHWNQVFNAAGEVGSLSELVSQIAKEFVSEFGTEAHLTYRPGPPPAAPTVDCRKIHKLVPGIRYTPLQNVLSGLVANLSRCP